MDGVATDLRRHSLDVLGDHAVVVEQMMVQVEALPQALLLVLQLVLRQVLLQVLPLILQLVLRLVVPLEFN